LCEIFVGGKYAGFGNTPMNPPVRSQSELFDTTLSSLTSGWSLLSLGANKVKENALKYGSYASQKVSSKRTFSKFRFLFYNFYNFCFKKALEVSQNVAEKVLIIFFFFYLSL
jgi:hypothetical protein